MRRRIHINPVVILIAVCLVLLVLALTSILTPRTAGATPLSVSPTAPVPTCANPSPQFGAWTWMESYDHPGIWAWHYGSLLGTISFHVSNDIELVDYNLPWSGWTWYHAYPGQSVLSTNFAWAYCIPVSTQSEVGIMGPTLNISGTVLPTGDHDGTFTTILSGTEQIPVSFSPSDSVNRTNIDASFDGWAGNADHPIKIEYDTNYSISFFIGNYASGPDLSLYQGTVIATTVTTPTNSVFSATATVHAPDIYGQNVTLSYSRTSTTSAPLVRVDLDWQVGTYWDVFPAMSGAGNQEVEYHIHLLPGSYTLTTTFTEGDYITNTLYNFEVVGFRVYLPTVFR